MKHENYLHLNNTSLKWVKMLNLLLKYSSVVMAFATIITLFYTIHSNRSEKNRAQASRISTWLVGFKDDEVEDNTAQEYYLVHNGSQEPVYNVLVFLHFNADRVDASSGLKMISGGEQYCYLEVLPPGDTEISFNYSGLSMGNGHMVVAIFFTDSRNREWYRRANGVLRPAKYIREAQIRGILLKHV
jgi:hypothetical protein